MSNGFQSLGTIFEKKKEGKKPPAYQWQDLALRIIKELNIPSYKRNSVFKVCKDYDKDFVEKALDDTKELCQISEKWKYFFKVISEERKNSS